ncbi:RAMP superfamily CRISPR-associated protein [Leptotrichia trevisanii]|uniref:RAMP superfamily CRISPR-associated protein n=1 Tax=Leptotrichia trevisanii TaxID=109328 RepID=UPI0026F005F1|nr:RAMP superfamily CRISPR-associated protein [Leptotrichia trevisanii]
MGIKIGYEVKLLAPANTAETGTIGKEIDVEIKRDKNGTPYFSAKHIKGIFRGKILEFRNAFAGINENVFEEYFGDNLNGEKFAEKYFGSEGNNPSKIRFSDLKFQIENSKKLDYKIGNRYGIKINRKTRVAEDNSLFNYEFVKPKNIFIGNFELSNNFFEKNENEEKLEKNLKFLLASFLHIDKIGGLKSRGLGKVEIRFTSVGSDKNFDLTKESNRFETVKEISEIILKDRMKNLNSKELGKVEKYTYTLNFLEPSVLQGRLRKNEAELRNSLQGSSIRGAIIQYGLNNNFKIEDLLKIKISEVKKIVRKDGEEKEEFKLASGFKTKYPVKNNKPEKIDKTISVMREYKTDLNDENGIKLERDSLALLTATGTELSIKIDEKTRTAKESFLFNTEYTDLTKNEISFKGNIEIPEGLFEIGKEYELKIGKFKTKGFGKVKIKFEKYSEKQGMNIKDKIEKLNNQIKEDFVRFDEENNRKSEEKREKVYSGDEKLKKGEQKLITFDFLSDMILPFNEVSNVGEQILILFEDFEEKLTLNNRRTFINVEKLRGYNIVNNIRKMDEIVITQGSVISYCINNENLEEILEKLEKIEKDGIGLRRNEGFGRVRICSERI